MSGSPYVVDYDRTFTFAVSVTALWAHVVRVDQFPSWWNWLHEFSVDGTPLESGTVLRGVVAPPLPYRMRLEVVIDECVPTKRIVASVHGDLEGTAQLAFAGDDTAACVHATWTIEMMQRPMRLAATVAHSLLLWGHDRVVDATVEGFRHHLVGDGTQ